MFAWYFPVWNRRANCAKEDVRIDAETLTEAVAALRLSHGKGYILGDCRACHSI